MKVSFTKRKLLSAALGLTVLSGLSGFGNVGHAEGKGLLIWINGDKGYAGIVKIGEEFAQKNGVKVTVERPEDAPTKFQQAAAAGKGPDIWIWQHDRIGEWITGGLLQPLTPSKAARDGIAPFAWSAFTVGGKTYGYPISIEAVSLIYNKDLVATPPKSFDEVLVLDKKLKAKGKQAILWDYTNIFFSWPLLAAGGASAFEMTKDGNFDAHKTDVNSPSAVAGLDTIMKLINAGAMAKGASYAEMEAGFNSGKVAMMINGPWAWDNAKKAHINFGVAAIPSVNGKAASPFVGVLGAMISKASSNKELATEFIENNMLTLNGLKAINAAVPLGTPANKAFYNELKNDPNIQATMASAQSGHPMPSNPEMGRFWSSMKSALENVTQGRQSTKEGLDAVAKRILSDSKDVASAK